MIPADVITRHEFDQRLAEYPDILNSVSSSKTVKHGQRTLQDLDRYRYDEAPTLFSDDALSPKMDIDAIKTLVEWKLRHGTFRPTLMSLVSSNDPKLAADTVNAAFTVYRQSGDVAASLAVLTRLKGIGPATASLLLAVYDPTGAIFFSDEAFYWLCCAGKKSPIKYNAKEYKLLFNRARELTKRIDVSAADIEKVAYVLMKKKAGFVVTGSSQSEANPRSSAKGRPAKRKTAPAESESLPKNEAHEKRPKRTRAKA